MSMSEPKAYKPRSEQETILDRALELVQGVPYQVSARWLFYALLQEGAYPDKESYKGKLLPLLAKGS
jgi:ABC-type antimicrobial peptide transport system ATPase subunit